jgi:N-acetylmuramoyl-L-alanine amidase
MVRCGAMTHPAAAPLPIIETHCSPNHGARRPVDGRTAVRHLVIHYTGMRTGADALARLCDGGAQVSAHYLIEEDGTAYRLVPEHLRAWHAGVSFWRGVRDINSTSIGIELVNPGHAFGYRAFPQRQIAALMGLVRALVDRHGIAPLDVVGHSDIAPGRKEDPGELFPWAELAQAGIGIWPAAPQVPVNDAWDDLARIGYAVPGGAGGEMLDAAQGAADVVRAFQRRFRPGTLDGVLDHETRGLIAAVASAAPLT